MRIRFHPDATAELEQSADWYAEFSTIAARDFCEAVNLAIERISSDPESYERVDDRHHACGVRCFPFQVVFRCTKDCVDIIAVAHAKRRPNYWRGR